MQRSPIRSRHSKKKRLFLLVLLAIFLILLISVLFIPHFAKRSLYISPVTKNSSQDAKKLESLLVDAQITFASISLHDDSSYRVLFEDGGEVILSIKKDIEKQITSLQPILKQLTIDGRRFNRIDFRYDKPLVVYE
jgi:cell division septal protein FtsQ